MLSWDDGGETMISFIEPEVLAESNHLHAKLASRLAGIGHSRTPHHLKRLIASARQLCSRSRP